ncbi:MAG: putative Zn-dependent peptidase [Myxococcales bacterium]|nr:putative Zn-dependent peptidase [Myxococcales bacterium]
MVGTLGISGIWGLLGCASAPPPPPASVPVAVFASAPVATPTTPAPAPPERATPDAPFRQTQPGPGPEPTFAVPAFKRFKLKNGLEVLLAEFHELPLVELNLVVKAGGATNGAELSGLADMTRRMLDEGTKTRTPPQIADQLASLGAVMGGGSGWDSSSATLSVLVKNLAPALAVFADVVVSPAFAEAEFARVRDNSLTAITRRKDSPPTIASLTLARLLYGAKHPYGWPQTGVEASLKKMTPAALRATYDRYWHPDNAVLIAAGDISEASLRPLLEDAFKAWKPRKAPLPKLPAPGPAADKTRIFLVDKAGAPQSSIRVGGIGIARTSPDYFSVTVMNMILGGGFYRLDLNLREGKAWTYGARSSFEARKAPGPFGAGGEFVAAHTAESVQEIIKEINGMRDADVTDAELARAKDQLIKSFPARFATRAAIANQLAEIAVYGLPARYLADYTKKVAAVTKDDVRRVARKYLLPDRLTIVVVGDATSLRDKLEKIAPVELRDVEGNPLPSAEPPKPAPPTGGGD